MVGLVMGGVNGIEDIIRRDLFPGVVHVPDHQIKEICGWALASFNRAGLM